MSYQIIGQSIPRVDNTGKVTGDARYTADVLLSGTLWAKTLRSPYPHARIARVDTSRAEKAPGVRAILTGADVRGILYGRRYRDISVLAQDRVRFIGERVAAVAADTLEQTEEALEFLEVDYEELPAIFDPVAALQEGAPIIHPDVNSYPGLPKPLARPSNAFVNDIFTRGNIAEGFAQSDVVVENTFTVSRVHQAFLEPHCCLVWIDDQDRVQMWSPNKAPQGLKESMSAALNIPKEKIRVNPVVIGGDFGGKGAPIDEPICYLLALRTGRPVKMVMEYREEFVAGAPRHAAVIRLKTGVKRDGTMVTHEMEAYLDSGAYGGFRPGAVVGGIAHAGGCYRAEHARIAVSRVYTNNLPGGQMRAPGEPQGFFAAESHMDCVARKLGMDPYEFRLKNLIEEGETTLTGGHYRGIKAKDTLKAAVKTAGYKASKAANMGRGIAMGYRGPGAGSTSLSLSLNPDGTIVIRTCLFEQGTGTYTTLRQIVAEELSLKPDEIQIQILDTDSGVPFDSGIGGSRGTRVASGAAFQAARAAKQELLDLAEKLLGWPKSETVLVGKELVHKKTRKRKRWDKLLSRAGRSVTGAAIHRDEDHSPVTAFAAQIAEVSVDTETGEVKLRRLTTAHDTGVIVNPIGHQGQVDGGVVQGIGYGLIEYLPVHEGHVGTAHFGEYKIPTVKDIPELKTVIVKGEAGVGPYKTKGIGENPISPVAAAIANAVEDAVGVRIKDLPITAEKVLNALRLR
ncbi:MAG: xanthine dehydrogenase family protein molybdopterin-binding subunit [Deltaproteobacteria bacterium]|nr:MAG: xanthine dehydrogenase family protein molybdopterin-binding subunit [Deltaproteobacteria bacterium]